MKLNRKKMSGWMMLFIVMAGMLMAASSVLAAPESRGNVIDIPFRADKPFEVDIIFSDMPWYAYKETWTLFKEIEKATNVKLNVMVIPVSDYNDKRNLLIVSGDAPTIMPKSYPGQEIPYIPSGQILAVSDYIDLMPNFKASVEAWKLQEDLKTITKRDGKFYVIPGLHETFTGDY